MTLTIIGVIISLISPIVAVYLFSANKKFVLDQSKKNTAYIKQLHSEKISIEKMDNIISSFLEMYNESKDTGISALIKSGIKSIDNEHGINYIIAEIHNRTGRHPLGSYKAQIEQASIAIFFQKIDLPTLKTSGGIEKIISESNIEKNQHNNK
jgi:hypothetical protein